MTECPKGSALSSEIYVKACLISCPSNFTEDTEGVVTAIIILKIRHRSHSREWQEDDPPRECERAIVNTAWMQTAMELAPQSMILNSPTVIIWQ